MRSQKILLCGRDKLTASIFKYKRPESREIPALENESTQPSIFQYRKPEFQLEEVVAPQEEEKKGFMQSLGEQMLESEQLEKDIERHAARGLSRVAETLIGMPGDLQAFINNLLPEKLSKSQGALAEGVLPTSKGLREFSEKATMGYTKPQSPLEEKSDELIGDVASTLYGRGPKGIGTGLIQSLGIPIVSNLVKEGVSYKTADEKKASSAKMGTMLALDLLNARQTHGVGGSRNFIRELFSASERSVPQGAVADARTLERSLNNLRADLQRGGTSPSKTSALNKIEELFNKIQNGSIDPREFPSFRRSINELIEGQGGWAIDVPPAIRQRTINNLSRVKREVVEAGENYGRTQNPVFGELWSRANEASAVRSRSEHVTNFIKKNFGNKFKSVAASFLFGLGGGTAALGGSILGKAASAASIGATLAPIYKGAQYLQRVIQSPTLRHYYSEVIRYAGQNNAPKMIKAMQALDAALAKEEKQEKELIEKYTK